MKIKFKVGNVLVSLSNSLKKAVNDIMIIRAGANEYRQPEQDAKGDIIPDKDSFISALEEEAIPPGFYPDIDKAKPYSPRHIFTQAEGVAGNVGSGCSETTLEKAPGSFQSDSLDSIESLGLCSEDCFFDSVSEPDGPFVYAEKLRRQSLIKKCGDNIDPSFLL